VRITPEDRFLSVLPLAHTYECTVGFLVPFINGASITYLGRPPVLSVLLPALEAVKPTMMLTVPLIMEKIYQNRVRPLFHKKPLGPVLHRLAPLRKLVHRIAARKVYRTFGGALRFFGIGGAPLCPDAELFLREGRFPYSIGYGLTETAPLLAGTDASGTRYRSTGPAIDGVSLRIDNSVNADEAHGEGEIQARGPNIMMGYYKNPEETARVFTSDGWFKTGDLGRFGRNGYLYIRGRLKNMILGPSGENIYPEEIEAVINQQEFVQESLVYQAGGRIVARVYLNYEEMKARWAEFSADSMKEMQKQLDDYLQNLRKSVNAGLNSFSRLSEIILQTEPFEKTPTKKIKRFLYIGA
jgi:long-chain acyl-CoA synthetase